MKSVAFTAKMTRLNARALLSVEKILSSSSGLKVSNAFSFLMLSFSKF